MTMQLDLLGHPRVRDAEGVGVEFPLGKPFALLSYLALEHREVSRDELADILWPTSTPDRARHSVRQAIWLIRKELGEELLEGEDPVRLSPSLVRVDVDAFREALGRGDVDGARCVWRGPLLDQLALKACREWEHWQEEQREAVRREFFQALLDRGRDLVAGGEQAEGLHYLLEAIAVNPYSLEARLLQIETLLERREEAGARQALEEARREVGDSEGAEESLASVEERLRVLKRRSSAEAPERLGESVEFVGRAGELSDLRGLWKRVQGGRSGCACVVGPTGIGKTRLAAEFLVGVEEGGGLVARSKGYRGEHRIRWGGVADLVRVLLSLPGARGISSASEAVLHAMLPSLGTNGSGGESYDRSRDPASSYADAVLDLVEAVAFEEPLAVFVDDWQWVDKESRALLWKVMRRASGLPCLFLLAERTGERRLRQEGAEDVVGSLGGRKVVLGPLSQGELGELLGMLAEFTSPGRVDEVVERVDRVTGGNPLFVGEILRKLAEEGVYRWQDGGWVLAVERVPEELDLPESVQELIRERLDRLSPGAAQVAGALAAERRSVPVEVLRRRAGVDEAVFTRAMGELLDREVVEWVGPKRLDFTHDQLREAMGVGPQVGRWGRLRAWARERPGWAAVMAIMVLLLVGTAPRFLSAFGGPSPEVPPATYPYGRGELLVWEANTAWVLVPPRRESEEWVRAEAPGLVPTVRNGAIRFVGRDLQGGLRFFGELRRPDRTPWVVEYSPNGETEDIFATEGDDMFRDYLPGAEELLVTSENLSTPGNYDNDLFRISLLTGAKDTLYRARERISPARWSPDGTRIAAIVTGVTDTLIVMDAEGRRVEKHPMDDYRSVRSLSWCGNGPFLALGASTLEGGVGVLFDFHEGTKVEFALEKDHVSDPECLGEARATLYAAIDSTSTGIHRAFFLHDFASGEERPIPGAVVHGLRGYAWLPMQVQPPIRSLAIQRAPDRLPWGGREKLEARALRYDGTTVELDGISWQSFDPSVISVSEDGTISGNGVGTTWIKASYRESVRDSVRLRVDEADYGGEDLLFREDFSDPSLPGWIRYGRPAPVTMEWREETVLFLNGDGSLSDGLAFEPSFSFTQGATLELEFRLPLTRRDHQRLVACLLERTPGFGLPPQDTRLTRNRLCFHYPSNELSKHRPDLALVRSGFFSIGHEESVAPILPSNEWVHLALQVRADGKTSVLLNRTVPLETGGRVTLNEGIPWSLRIFGHSVDTELLVRNLVLWRGERYTVPDPIPTPTREPGSTESH